jgi:ketosteroid isomerase-like protein
MVSRSKWAPGAVLDWSNSRGLEPGVFRGRDEIREYVRRFLEAFEEVRIELDDPIDIGDDRLIVDNVAYLRGRDGIETQAHSAWLITFRGGEQRSLTLYQTKREAFEAAGVSA